MRGKVAFSCGKDSTVGITPAHAGKSADGNIGLQAHQDHPRPCGEKRLTGDAVRQNTGSPPPMRGKGSEILRLDGAERITPAHAGKSIEHLTFHFCHKDHPRPCGEKMPPRTGSCMI